jgi:2,3-dimethylmalate lyase
MCLRVDASSYSYRRTSNTMIATSKTARLRELINRKDKVLAIMHPTTAMHARIMEQAGCEAGFVGTNSVVGSYMGLADVGTMTMTECVMVAKWFARTVNFPIIIDGDTGHGGIMAVRRLVSESIEAGIAGIRIDDQPIEGKRRTRSAGLEVVPLEQAIARYRAAVDMKNELDPNFVIMAQCYARNAANSDFEDTLLRLKAYKEQAGVDWVQLECPHSIEEIKKARATVQGAFSFMKGQLPRFLSLKEHLDLGINLAWYPSFTHNVLWAALWDFMQAFKEKEIGAWEEFVESRKNKPYPTPLLGPDEESPDKQEALERRYFSAETLKKYEKGNKTSKRKGHF